MLAAARRSVPALGQDNAATPPPRPRGCNDDRMHVLTNNNELVSFYGPICNGVGTNTRCQCAQLIGLESCQPVEIATIADRNLTIEDLEKACLTYLEHTGWAATAPQATRELAEAMALDIVDVASEFPAGPVNVVACLRRSPLPEARQVVPTGHRARAAAHGGLAGHPRGRQPEGGAADARPRQRRDDAGRVRRSVRIRPRCGGRKCGQNVATVGCFALIFDAENVSTSAYAGRHPRALVMPGMTSGHQPGAVVHPYRQARAGRPGCADRAPCAGR